MTTEVTSERIGKIASRGLRFPESLTLEEIKSLCASVLTQRPNRVKKALAAVVSVFKAKPPA